MLVLITVVFHQILPLALKLIGQFVRDDMCIVHDRGAAGLHTTCACVFNPERPRLDVNLGWFNCALLLLDLSRAIPSVVPILPDCAHARQAHT